MNKQPAIVWAIVTLLAVVVAVSAALDYAAMFWLAIAALFGGLAIAIVTAVINRIRTHPVRLLRKLPLLSEYCKPGDTVRVIGQVVDEVAAVAPASRVACAGVQLIVYEMQYNPNGYDNRQPVLFDQVWKPFTLVAQQRRIQVCPDVKPQAELEQSWSQHVRENQPLPPNFMHYLQASGGIRGRTLLNQERMQEWVEHAILPGSKIAVGGRVRESSKTDVTLEPDPKLGLLVSNNRKVFE